MRVIFITTICTMVWLRLGATLCDIGQVWLKNKEEVETFESTYALCDSMRGTLSIRPLELPDILQLKYFDGIISCGDGLDSLGRYLTGFSQLREVKGRLNLGITFISENRAFENLITADHIRFIGNNYNFIYYGKHFYNLGFNKLVNANRIFIVGLKYNGPLYGFENLEDITQSLEIRESNFTKLNGFRRLKNIGRLFAPPGSAYEAMEFNLYDNKNLEDISNFDSLRLFPSQISDVDLNDNPKLSVCHVPFICRYIKERTGGTLRFLRNGPGCNSLDEVKNACLTGTYDETPASHSLSIYPNPADELLSFPDAESSAEVRIYDVVGRLRSETYGSEADVSGLPPGLYTVTLEQSGRVKTGRFVKR